MTLEMTEVALSNSIVHAARECGWMVYRTWNSMHSPAGFPDLCLVRNGKMKFWELKSRVGKMRSLQDDWIEALSAVPGVEAKVVRPADLEEAYKELI